MLDESNVRAGVSTDHEAREFDRAAGTDAQILEILTELKAEISALRTELLGQNQQMLSRMQFLHEGLLGRIKQLREPGPSIRRRMGRT